MTKLLFDQNLSFKLVSELSSIFPGSRHVREVGLDSSGDEVIWNYASKNGFAIVSKDSDFHQKSFLIDSPPKVIWIRTGNCSTEQIRNLFVKCAEGINEFVKDKTTTFLVIE